jgi:predicted AlkP superfamily phosphohydrolase/phosphomutase/tetratricopeptide (TPR) repeat protein
MSKSPRLAKRVLLIGWDAADWKLIDQYIADGTMPHMKQFLARGSRGNLATLKPVLSPMLWNSIGTGKRPYKHGIHGFTEPMPDGKGVRPSSSTTRKCKALWNILTQQGMTANVVSWFCGHPAEPINGICVSEMFAKVGIDKKDPQSTALPPLPNDCVHPESLREAMIELRLHPGELTEEEVLLFIPKAAKIDQAKDPRLTMFTKLFAEMASVHGAATFVMEQNDWDFMGVYYDSIDHFGHGFMEYHPPRMEHVSEEDFEIYQEVIAGCYRFHDLILGRLMNLAGEDTTIILCSDHGYHSDHLRPKETPKEPAGPAIWHRDFGVVAMAGPGIKQGEQISGATLLDIAPTVLNLLGLPAAEDMDGKTLTHVIGDQSWTPPKRIPSWEEVEGEAGMHPKDKQEDPFAAREALRQLVELGYIEEPDKDEEKAAQNAAREAKYNLARAYLDGSRIEEAATHLEELYQESPDQTRFGIALARVYMRQRRFEEVRSLAEGLLAGMEQGNLEKADRIDEDVRRIEEHPADVIAKAKDHWEKAHQKRVEAEQAKAKEEDREARAIEFKVSPIDDEYLTKRRRQLQEVSGKLRSYDVRSAPTVNLLLGRLEAMDGNFDQALEHLGKAEQAAPRLPGLHLQLGQTYLRIRRNEEAVRAYEKALEIDPDNAQAHEGLATALSRLHRYEEAVDHGLTAVELIHDMPRAHLRLGITLARLELYEKAVLALQTCLKLAPRTPAAHRCLAMLYRSKLGRADLASLHTLYLKQVQAQLKAGTSTEPVAQDPAAQGAASTEAESSVTPTEEGAQPMSAPGPAVDPGETVTIVTGLPRSGTSMMMQMLVAGGISPLTDGNREADDSNPKGYFEYDKATQLGRDSGWIGEGKGKVVKIVAQLLSNLPAEVGGVPVPYRIVFMDRDLEEVVASQRTMLDLQGRQGAKLGQADLAKVFQEQLQRVHALIEERKIPCLVVRHAEAIRDSKSVAERISQFFDGSLDVAAMAAVVDPALHREKAPPE